ncbi:hypothetical protein DM01DRAFT_307473 [Hesseltinella vesiculosa]|uniref:Uncharacterized protein n=1 Tax=Hesseltinella vesiculosa TaxID=101127 RepID=A0A1X2GQ95_9FUNG|nr:hypothetical protein DM01DRAFT_307473 [Hesseltinella vesiculosa]
MTMRPKTLSLLAIPSLIHLWSMLLHLMSRKKHKEKDGAGQWMEEKDGWFAEARRFSFQDQLLNKLWDPQRT